MYLTNFVILSAHLNLGKEMSPVSVCPLQVLVLWSPDRKGKFLCWCLANEETRTVWPEQQKETQAKSRKGG